MIFAAIKIVVSRIRRHRVSNSCGGNSSAPAAESTTEPTTWHAGQELEKRADEIERVDPRVRIIGHSQNEWIEGQGVEVRR